MIGSLMALVRQWWTSVWPASPEQSTALGAAAGPPPSVVESRSPREVTLITGEVWTLDPPGD
jgi:hypothetical protein